MAIVDSKYVYKTYVDILIAGIYNDIHIKTEIDILFPNIDLNNYYFKTEIDTLFPNTAIIILNPK